MTSIKDWVRHLRNLAHSLGTRKTDTCSVAQLCLSDATTDSAPNRLGIPKAQR